MNRQKGLATVEFAIIANAVILVIFAVIEMARMMFTVNTLTEITRRGARIAAVCPMNDPNIAQLAIMSGGEGEQSSQVLPNLTTSNISISYLDENGTAAAAGNVSYVSVAAQNYQHQLLIPFLPAGLSTFAMPPAITTKPVESLGMERGTTDTFCR